MFYVHVWDWETSLARKWTAIHFSLRPSSVADQSAWPSDLLEMQNLSNLCTHVCTYLQNEERLRSVLLCYKVCVCVLSVGVWLWLRAVTGAGDLQCKVLKLALSLLWMLTVCMIISQRSHVVWVGPPCPCGPCSTRQEPFRTWDHLVQCQGRLCRSRKLTSILTGWGSAADLCVPCMSCFYSQYIYHLPCCHIHVPYGRKFWREDILADCWKYVIWRNLLWQSSQS